MTRIGLWLGALALFTGCRPEVEVEWRPFNDVMDEIDIEVAPGDASGERSIELFSNTGLAVVGTATVTPARGPVGTSHRLAVVVGDDWAERVQRATIRSEGDRGEETYEMILDTALPGVFELDLVSLGADDEMRTDSWTIDLFEPFSAPTDDS